MIVKVISSPKLFDPAEYADKTTVVVDVLRATTTIVTAMSNGCREIFPVQEVDEAFELAHTFTGRSILLGGERKGIAVKGFDFGNSPLEYTAEAVYGKSIIFTTTNGTRAMRSAAAARETFILSFLNLRSVVNYLRPARHDVYILCAGREGEPALEDTVCAGMLAEKLLACSEPPDAGTREAITLASQHKNDLYAMLRLCQHGAYLDSIGFAADLDACARLNAIDVLPVLRDGSILSNLSIE